MEKSHLAMLQIYECLCSSNARWQNQGASNKYEKQTSLENKEVDLQHVTHN